jgi:hypothetical protein
VLWYEQEKIKLAPVSCKFVTCVAPKVLNCTTANDKLEVIGVVKLESPKAHAPYCAVAVYGKLTIALAPDTVEGYTMKADNHSLNVPLEFTVWHDCADVTVKVKDAPEPSVGTQVEQVVVFAAGGKNTCARAGFAARPRNASRTKRRFTIASQSRFRLQTPIYQ